MVTGFADRVDLGSFGDIETDHSVVMRVYLTDERVDPVALPELRWRGVAFDQFDGRAWSSTVAPRRYLRRGAGGDFGIGLPRGTGPILRQEIFLEPMGTDAVFGAPRVIRVEMPSPSLVADDMGGLTTSSASGRLHYVVESEVETGGRSSMSRARPAPPRPRDGADPLPPAARGIAGDRAPGPRGGRGRHPIPPTAARRISAYLSTHYRYTLALRRETARPPLEEFLFVRRSGNCEYFAASMAVMLRTLGIPSRVVAGFQQGEWNPYGRYFMVRLSDAHSWVEVHVEGQGWIAFDPSPRGESPRRAPGSLSLYLDAARMRWYRYVINWSLRDQVHLAAAVQRQPPRCGSGCRGRASGRRAGPWPSRAPWWRRWVWDGSCGPRRRPARDRPRPAGARVLRARPAPPGPAGPRARRGRDRAPVRDAGGRGGAAARRGLRAPHRPLRARPLRDTALTEGEWRDVSQALAALATALTRG
jgi:hypothetical protein